MSLTDIYGNKRKKQLQPEMQKIPTPQPIADKPSTASQLGQMALGIGMNKGIEKGMEYAAPYAEKAATAGKDFIMSQFAPSAAASAAPAATVGGAPLTGALASTAAPAATGAAATGGAAAGGMGAMGAGLMAAAPWVAGGLLADELLGLGIRENVLGFSQGGKVYAAEGEKIKMTPEQKAAFYNLQISNGKMTPEVAEGALINEFGMRPGIAQSLIQSQYNVRQTPTGPTSLFSNTPQVPNLPQGREVPMMNAPVNPYDEFTQVPRDLQQPPEEVTVNVQPRGQTPMVTNTGPYQRPTTATERTAAMEDLVTPTRVQQTAASEDIGAIPGDRGLNMGSFLGPLALAYLIGNR